MDLDTRYQELVKDYFLRRKKATYYCIALFLVGLLLGMLFFKSFGEYIFMSLTGIGLIQLFLRVGNHAFVCPSCSRKVPFTTKGEPVESCPYCEAGNIKKSMENTEFKDNDQLIVQDIHKQRERQKLANRFLIVLSSVLIVIFGVMGFNNGNTLASIQQALFLSLIVYFLILPFVQLKCPSCKKKLSLALPHDVKFCPHCHVYFGEEKL